MNTSMCYRGYLRYLEFYMPLYDVTKGSAKARKITPESIAGSEYLLAFERKSNPKTYSRVLKTVEETIGNLVVDNVGKLVWTKTGACFGHRSMEPKFRVDHLWQAAVNAMGEGREVLILVGTLLRLKISERPETWLLYMQETDDLDPETGKKIKVSNYWIDNDFSPPRPPNIEDLKAKWVFQKVRERTDIKGKASSAIGTGATS